MKTRLFSFFAYFLSFTLTFYPCSFALPELSEVVSGSADFHQDGSSLTVNTHSDKTIANYNSFSIGAGEAVTFNQPSASSVMLNRVIGGDPSSIFGSLNSNGQVFLVNPNGVFFSPGSRVDVVGLVAATLNISNADFLAGKYTFQGQGGYILNQGNIMVKPGGYACLVANSIDNQQVISATLGSVALASGDKVTLSLDDLGQINVVVDEVVKQALTGKSEAINNSGTVSAEGGKVLLTARALDSVFENAVNNSGVIEASALNNEKGEIILSAEGADVLNTGSLAASDIKAEVKGDFVNQGTVSADGKESAVDAGKIDVKAGSIYQNGTVSANAYNQGSSGDVHLTSNDLTLLGDGSLTQAKAAYDYGRGGEIYINALEGDVVVAGNAALDVSGGLLAGDAGLVNVYTPGLLEFAGTVLGRAGAGYKTGSVFLDPTDAIVSGIIGADTTVDATNNIDVSGDVTLADGVTLNLFADHNSSTASDWEDGVGTISASGSYTIAADAGASNTTLNLKAGSGIGSLASSLKVKVDNLSAEVKPAAGSSASIYIAPQAGLDLDISGLKENFLAGDPLSGTIQVAGPTNITLSGPVSTKGSLNLWASNLFASDYLTAPDGNYSLTIDADIATNGKNVSAIADGDIAIGAGNTPQIQSAGGKISFEADYRADGTGAIVQEQGSSVDSGSGRILLAFSGDSQIDSLTSISTIDPVTISFVGLGSIVDYGTLSIDAPGLLIKGNLSELDSDGVDLNVSVDKLSIGGFLDSSSGDINIVNSAKNLEVVQLASSGFGLENGGDGAISLSVGNGKSLTLANDVISQGGQVTLEADAGINANADIKSNGGNIILDSDLDNAGSGAFVQNSAKTVDASSSGEITLDLSGNSSVYSLKGYKVRVNLDADAALGSATSILADYILVNGMGHSLTSDVSLTTGLLNMVSPWVLYLSIGNLAAASAGNISVTNTTSTDLTVSNWASSEGADFGLNSGSGDITLSAESKNLNINNDAVTQGGTITLSAGQYINASADIKSNGGDISLTADSDSNGSGKIFQSAGKVINAGWVSSASPGGNVVLNTSGDNSVYSRLATVKGNTVKIKFFSDTALDDQGTTSITANSLLIDGNSHKLGSSGVHINTAVSKISLGSFLATSTGNFYVNNSGALETASVLSSGFGVVNAGSGSITISSSGAMTLTDTVSGNDSISLTASVGGIVDNNGVSNNISGSALTLSAVNGVDIDTNVSSLTATTTSGTIKIEEANDITLNTINTNGSGDITVISGGNIDATGNVTAATHTVELDATGSVIHSLNNGNKITANKLSIPQSTQVGDLSGGRPLDTAVSVFEVTSSGDVNISNTGSVNLNFIDTPTHDVKIVSSGSILDNDGGTVSAGDLQGYDIRGNNITLNVGSGGSIGALGAGNEIDLVRTGTFSKNTVPTDPSGLSSSSHTTATWSPDNTVDGSWNASTEPLYITGGNSITYSYEWSTSAATLPDSVSDTTGTSASSDALGDGNSWYLHVRAVDSFGAASSGAGHLGKFYIDATGPSLDAPSLSGTDGTNGWYTSDVTATISSGDDGSGSGVNTVEYRQNGGLWTLYNSGDIININTEGETPLQTRITDTAGNTTTYQAVNVKIDKTAPLINDPAFTGTSGLNGWYISNVNTTLSGSDAVSGIGSIEYSYDNGSTWSIYTGAFDITNQGEAVKLDSRITDTAGLTTSNLTIPSLKIDTTAPVITVSSPAAGSYTTSQTLNYSVSDNLTASPAVTGPLSNTVYSSLGGYTVLITAKDDAGNESSNTFDFTISSGLNENSQLTTDLNTNNNINNLNSGNLDTNGGMQFNSFNPAPTLFFYHPVTPVDNSSGNNSGGTLDNEAFEFIDGSLQGQGPGEQGGDSGSDSSDDEDDDSKGEK